MSRFIRDGFILALLFILINLVCFNLLTFSLLYKDYEALYSRLENKGKYPTIILSDSHGWALTHEKPRIKKLFNKHEIYNFSYGSDSYGDILIKLKWIIKNNLKVDTILLTVDDHMLSKASNNRNRNIGYSTANWHKEVYGISFPKFLYYKAVKYFPLLYPSNQKLISSALKAKLFRQFGINKKKNKRWAQQNLEERKKITKSRLKSFFPKSQFKFDEKLRKNFKNIIELSQNNGFTIIGIKYPIDSIMTEEIIEMGAIDHVKQEARNLGVSNFLDCQSRFSSLIYFNNQDHVNERGAEIVAKDIISYLKK